MLLVTGGAGYIGSHFIKYYLSNNKQSQVAVLDNFVEGHKEALALKGLQERIHLLSADIADATAVTELVRKLNIDAVIHFAAFCYVGESEDNPPKYFENNVAGSLRLMEALDAAGVKKMVFSSSCATYGNPQYMPLDESHPQDPVSVYGLSKYMIERALHAYGRTRNWSSVCLRYFNAAGADAEGEIGESHHPETHLIPRVLKVASKEIEQLEVYGDDYKTEDGTCIRDYIHVTDLADAHCRALNKLDEVNAGMEAFNLGTATGASVKQVIDTCQKVTGKTIKVKMLPRRPGDVSHLVANSSKAGKQLGWTAKHDLEDIIKTAWQWETNRRF